MLNKGCAEFANWRLQNSLPPENVDMINAQLRSVRNKPLPALDDDNARAGAANTRNGKRVSA